MIWWMGQRPQSQGPCKIKMYHRAVSIIIQSFVSLCQEKNMFLSIMNWHLFLNCFQGSLGLWKLKRLMVNLITNKMNNTYTVCCGNDHTFS